MGYDKSQRAYQIQAENNSLSFVLDAAVSSPIVNPCFVLEGWDRETMVKMDGVNIMTDKNLRQGLVRDTNGRLQLVVLILMNSEKPVKIEFEKN